MKSFDVGVFSLLVVCFGVIIYPLGSYRAHLFGVVSSLQHQVSWVREGADWISRHKEESPLADLRELDEAEAVRDLHRIAAGTGMKVESIRPAPARSGQGLWAYDELLLNVAGRGSEAALFSFMRSLILGDHLWRLHECDLRSGSKKDGSMAGRWKIGILRHVKRKAGSRRLTFSEIFKKEEPSVWPTSGRTVFSAAASSMAQVISLETTTEGLKDLVLVAVMDDGSAQAALEDRRTRRSFVVREGDAIEGMKVTQISDGALTLVESGGAAHRLSM